MRTLLANFFLISRMPATHIIRLPKRAISITSKFSTARMMSKVRLDVGIVRFILAIIQCRLLISRGRDDTYQNKLVFITRPAS